MSLLASRYCSYDIFMITLALHFESQVTYADSDPLTIASFFFTVFITSATETSNEAIVFLAGNETL